MAKKLSYGRYREEYGPFTIEVEHALGSHSKWDCLLWRENQLLRAWYDKPLKASAIALAKSHARRLSEQITIPD